MSTKHDRESFTKEVKKFLVKMGAVYRHESGRWELMTRYGLLALFADESNYKKTIGTVFTRFDDVKKVPINMGCNPFSGKWNHHYFDGEGWTLESALENFMMNVLSCLPEHDQEQHAGLIPNYRLSPAL